MSKEKLVKSIEETEEQLKQLKQELKDSEKSFPQPGDFCLYAGEVRLCIGEGCSSENALLYMGLDFGAEGHSGTSTHGTAFDFVPFRDKCWNVSRKDIQPIED